MSPEISIIIPCHNEEKIIFKTYKELKKELRKFNQDYEIIFCNDGSTDNTLVELKKIAGQDSKVRFITYCYNRGAGYAFRQICRNVSGRIIIHMDADLAMSPSDTLNTFLREIEGTDIVVGSRYGNVKAEFPLHRLIPSKLVLCLNRLLFRHTLKDTNSGFFAIKKETLNAFQLNSDGFQIYTELFVKAIRNNLNIKEIPIKFVHKTESGEASIFKHGPKILIDIFRLWRELGMNEKRRI